MAKVIETIHGPEAARILGIKTSTLNTYVWAHKVKAIKRPGWRTVFDRDYILSIANGSGYKNAAPELDPQKAACTDTTTDMGMIAYDSDAVKSEEVTR